MFRFNDNRKDHKQVQLSDRQLKEIENRQKLAIMLNAKEKIEDYKNEVFGIIEEKGLKNEDNDKSLKTALQVLEYIIPKKKALETTVNVRKIEDIIKDDIQDAEIIEDNQPPEEGK